MPPALHSFVCLLVSFHVSILFDEVFDKVSMAALSSDLIKISRCHCNLSAWSKTVLINNWSHYMCHSVSLSCFWMYAQ